MPRGALRRAATDVLRGRDSRPRGKRRPSAARVAVGKTSMIAAPGDAERIRGTSMMARKVRPPRDDTGNGRTPSVLQTPSRSAARVYGLPPAPDVAAAPRSPALTPA